MAEDIRGEVARFLRQRLELGHDPVVLGSLARSQALYLVDAAASSRLPAVVSVAPPGGPSGRAGTGTAPAAEATASDAMPRSAPPATGPAPPPAALSDEDVGGISDYDALREAALGCTRCGLCETRSTVVFSDGNPSARVMVVGEAPGANEDRTGLPFVGQAGKLLDLLLAAIGLSRTDSVYICNVLKCRPPGNRNPTPEEIRLCSPYLRRQIALVSPQVILAVGTFSAQLLTGQARPLGKLRGEVYSYEGVPLVVSYHPAALLRNSGWTRSTWDDLQLLRQVLDGS